MPHPPAIFEHPPVLFAFLAAVVATIQWIARVPRLQRFFGYVPPLIWTYIIPMILASMSMPGTGRRFIPHESPVYDFVSEIILPAVIVWLLIGTDVVAILRVGRKGLAMMLIGTFGILVGAAASFALFQTVLPAGVLPDDMWKGVASLSGSWIGGSPNLVAIAESVDCDSTLKGKMILVDTVCGYTWLGILIALVGAQRWFDHRNRADASLVSELAERLDRRQAECLRPLHMIDFITILAVGLVVSQLCLWSGGAIARTVLRAEASGGLMSHLYLSQVMTAFGWGVLLTTAASIALSLTPLRRLEDAGVSSIGNAGLYLLLATIGANADLSLVSGKDVWIFAIGAVWLAIHILILFAGAILLRAPLFLVATASMANIGGTASAPVVASAFHPSLAPVGLLLAILGSILGTPVGLLVVGKVCAAIAGG